MAEPTLSPEAKAQELKQHDPALLAAWRRFVDYDRVSTAQKAEYQSIRSWVITLGLAASTGAVLSVFVSTIPFLGQGLKEFLRIALIILPIVSVALMNYSAQFATSTAWIEYRVGAETIRSAIYRYRLRAGEFMGKGDLERQKLLLDVIHAADQRIEEQGATLPYVQQFDDTLLEKIATKTDTPALDNGLNPLDLQQYIESRSIPQMNWYIRKISNDYDKMRRERIQALVVAGAGSVISGLGWGLEGLVAITTAMGVALTRLAEMRMYGATYGIFHMTATRIQEELTRWQILPLEEQRKPEVQAQFVANFEKIFEDEREMWRAHAINTQLSSEENISNNLKQSILAQSNPGQPLPILTATGITVPVIVAGASGAGADPEAPPAPQPAPPAEDAAALAEAPEMPPGFPEMEALSALAAQAASAPPQEFLAFDEIENGSNGHHENGHFAYEEDALALDPEEEEPPTSAG